MHKQKQKQHTIKSPSFSTCFRDTKQTLNNIITKQYKAKQINIPLDFHRFAPV